MIDVSSINRLMLAVLTGAFQQFENPIVYQILDGRVFVLPSCELAPKDVRVWIESENEGWVFDYKTICDQLGLSFVEGRKTARRLWRARRGFIRLLTPETPCRVHDYRRTVQIPRTLPKSLTYIGERKAVERDEDAKDLAGPTVYVCRICGDELPPTEFAPSYLKKSWQICKECDSDRGREYRDRKFGGYNRLKQAAKIPTVF